MQDITAQPLNGHHDDAEHLLDKIDLTAAAIRLGIGVDGVRRRLQRGSLQGVKEDGKWFVLLAADQPQDSVQQDAEHLDRSTEQLLDAAEQRHIDFLEAQNTKLWEELAERRREVSELHILLRREQEQNELKQLPPPYDYVESVPQATEQLQNKSKKGFWS